MIEEVDNIAKLAEQQERGFKELITEDSVALEFTQRHRDKLRFDHNIGKWFVWIGTHWQREQTKLAFSWARELVRELTAAESVKCRAVASKTSFAAGVERFTQSDRAFAVTADIWDQDFYLLGTPGGTVDLRTGELRPARPEDYITKTTAVTPAATAECPRWMQFLREATSNDDGLITFLHQFSGYVLTGDIKEHALVFVYGPGGNGKGVFQNTVGGILKDYCATAAMETFTASPSDRHPTDLAMLRGARLVTASETEEGRAWAEGRIKQMTGGDPISARFMRQDFFTFRPQFKLFIIGNHKPSLRNVDDAARRRFNIVLFTYKPPVRDLDLEKKLEAEWPGILRWMIDGCLACQRGGLSRPRVVLDATEEYFTEQDSITQWIEERCETGQGTLADTSTHLFKSWSSWAVANGEKPGTTKWFAQALRRLGFKQFRKNKARGFLGIEAKPEEPTARYWNNNDD
jgi:putative DNA primase/helicase